MAGPASGVRAWVRDRCAADDGGAFVEELAGFVLTGLSDTHEHTVFFRTYELADPVLLTDVTNMTQFRDLVRAKLATMRPNGVCGGPPMEYGAPS